MGTRGAVGFALDGKLKLTYNHYDSYPSGLGDEVMGFVRNIVRCETLENLKAKVKSLEMVEEGSKPTKAQIQQYKDSLDLSVGEQNSEDWYCLLRGLQGVKGLEAVAEGKCLHLTNSENFPEESLFCEWAYVMDLDRQVVEVYKGFQSKAHKKGRFANAAKPANWNPDYKGQEFYYPCKLVMEIPFEAVAFENEICLKTMDKFHKLEK